MCIETMEVSSKPVETSCTRRSVKPVSKMRWKQLRVSAHGEEQALKLFRLNVVRTNTPKYFRREAKRVDLISHTKIIGGKELKASVSKRGSSAAWLNGRPAGAMAPGNTTQYLMSKVYEDLPTDCTQSVQVSDVKNGNLYLDCLSPRSVYAELDSRYESSFDFQMQDFEEVLDQFC